MAAKSRVKLSRRIGAVLAASLLLVPAAKSVTFDPFSEDSTNVRVPHGKPYVYKQSGGEPRDLEVYFPPDWDPSKNKVPGIIFFHGGDWTGGNLNQFRYACQYFAGRGLVAATVNYRMIPREVRDGLPKGESFKRACLLDAKSAIRWMKQHAVELGVDPESIITAGGSAGGHLAVVATAAAGINDPADPEGIDTGAQAFLLFNPNFKPDDTGDLEADVQKYLTADLPPAIVFFGDQDSYLTYGSEALSKLKSVGHSGMELWIAKGQPHGFFNNPPWQDVVLAEADRFLVEHGFLNGPCTLSLPSTGERLIKAP